nr:hypothetical protein [Tanacetum cinerariifolium]
MMNELVRNQCDVTNHQVNVQFLLQLQQEWQRFVTLVKQSQELKTVTYHKLYDIRKQRQNEVNEIKFERLAQVTPDAADNSGPIFDSEPLQKVSNDNNYNVLAIESEHPEQSKSVHDTYPIEQDEHNVIIDSLDMSYDKEQLDQDDDDDLANERELLASLIEKLKCEIDDNKNRNKFLETSNNVLVDKLKGIWACSKGMSETKTGKGYSLSQGKDAIVEQIDQDDNDDLVNERDLLASLIEKLKCEINDSKNHNKFLETSNKVLVDKLKGQ